jgi:uncharacterized protein YjbJ (UPF0337 family)
MDMGTADKAKGKLKEAVGSVTGSDDLRKEGQAQQHKGRLKEKAAKARATAEKHEREAEIFEHEERNVRAPDATFRTGPWGDCQGSSSP